MITTDEFFDEGTTIAIHEPCKGRVVEQELLESEVDVGVGSYRAKARVHDVAPGAGNIIGSRLLVIEVAGQQVAIPARVAHKLTKPLPTPGP